MKKLLYLDNASTTFPKPEIVYKSMDHNYRTRGFNAGRSGHSALAALSDMILETRSMLAILLGGPAPDKIVFMPSATICLNTIIQGLSWRKNDVVYVSPFEHNAVLRPLHRIRQEFDIKIKLIPVNRDYRFDLKNLEKLLIEDKPRLICCTHVSNVLGLICPVEAVAALARKHGSVLLVDGTQGAGLIDVNVVKAGIDFYVFAGHKTLYGPFGIAGYIYNSEIRIRPLYFGGTGTHSEQEFCPDVIPTRYEAGSPNILSISGLHASLKWLQKHLPPKIFEHERKTMHQLKNFLTRLPDLEIVEIPDEISAGIVSCIPQKGSSTDYAKFLDREFNIVVRPGAHCAPYAHEFLGTLDSGTVRFSLGYFNKASQFAGL
ncbi:MAG: aminotransferase class V-fold PLP-dependent enzyme [Candidatus Wallbacteria bacterium]|nr:aminotransferase class V-fold PLP-dependent enzyme [Candidatus Wallbacteria bacterium]